MKFQASNRGSTTAISFILLTLLSISSAQTTVTIGSPCACANPTDTISNPPVCATDGTWAICTSLTGTTGFVYAPMTASPTTGTCTPTATGYPSNNPPLPVNSGTAVSANTNTPGAYTGNQGTSPPPTIANTPNTATYSTIAPAAVSLSATATPASRYPTAERRFVAYWSIYGQYGLNMTRLLPEPAISALTHVILFAGDMANQGENYALPNYLPIQTNFPFWYSQIPPQTPWAFQSQQSQAQFRTVNGLPEKVKIMACLGGWGYDEVFRYNTQDYVPNGPIGPIFTEFVKTIVDWVRYHEYDGLDIDWEYPGGDGADWKARPPYGGWDPNGQLKLLGLMNALRTELPNKILSVAVGVRPEDIDLTINSDTGQNISKVVDMVNIMAFDFVNRRDTFSGVHSGYDVISKAVAYFSSISIPLQKMNVGWATYAKYFPLAKGTTCAQTDLPSKCALAPMETTASIYAGNPVSFATCTQDCLVDDGTSGDVTYDKRYQLSSYPKATAISEAAFPYAFDVTKPFTWNGIPDPSLPNAECDDPNSDYFLDLAASPNLFWTWVSPKKIANTCPKTWDLGIGGQMVYTIGQDFVDPNNPTVFGSLAKCMSANPAT